MHKKRQKRHGPKIGFRAVLHSCDILIGGEGGGE